MSFLSKVFKSAMSKDYLKNKLLQRDKGLNYTLLGVGTVAIISVLSSVLSNERNTRGN